MQIVASSNTSSFTPILSHIGQIWMLSLSQRWTQNTPRGKTVQFVRQDISHFCLWLSFVWVFGAYSNTITLF